MPVEGVALIPRCAECDALWLPADPERWRAYLGCEEDLDERAELYFYCPECAQREFGESHGKAPEPRRGGQATMDAVLPLIGVVIGAVIGAASTFLLDRRREQRAARAGVRLVVDELQEIRKTPTAETADWVISNLQGQPLSTRQWKDAQELLAVSLSDDDRTALAEAYRVVVLVNEVAQAPQADERLELLEIIE